MEILRLAGGAGAGKSTVAWEVFQQYKSAGVRVGYVDTDQLGMCYPAHESDPDRWHLKEAVLGAVARRFHEAGIETLVVSGVAETAVPPPEHGFSATSIWIDADETSRRTRLAARGWTAEQVDASAGAGTAESANAHSDWIRLSTEQLSIDAVTQRVISVYERGAVRAQAPRGRTSRPASSAASGKVVWITGPRLSGASTLGWSLASAKWRAGYRTGFADAGQLAFLANADATGAALANAVSLHEAFARVGATGLVVVAPFEMDPADITDAFPHAECTVVRLNVDESSRRTHVEDRRRQAGQLLAGDDLHSATPAQLAAMIAQATKDAAWPPRGGEIILDISRLDVAQATAALQELLDGERGARLHGIHLQTDAAQRPLP